jgi:SAM-dependent methyltransferase
MFSEWIVQLERRHLAHLRMPEVARALRALSSAYVERREVALGRHRALDGAGKRAAFGLYYGPLHFLAVRDVLSRIGEPGSNGRGTTWPVVDLGCGTGAVGAAVADWAGARAITGVDLHPWALDEARHTYRLFGLDATLVRARLDRFRLPRRPAVVVAGYVANEMAAPARERLLTSLLEVAKAGSSVLVVEPLASLAAPWWPDWVHAFGSARGQAGEWKLAVHPPPMLRRLGEAAGLDPTSVKLRTLWVDGARRMEDRTTELEAGFDAAPPNRRGSTP